MDVVQTVLQVVEPDLSERGQAGSRADGPDDEAGAVRGGETRRHLSSQPRGGAIDLAGPVGQVVLSQHQPAGAEVIRLDGVASHGQEPGVDLADHLGAGEDEELVAPVPALEVVGGEIAVLDRGAHGPIEDQDPLSQAVSEIPGHVVRRSRTLRQYPEYLSADFTPTRTLLPIPPVLTARPALSRRRWSPAAARPGLHNTPGEPHRCPRPFDIRAS